MRSGRLGQWAVLAALLISAGTTGASDTVEPDHYLYRALIDSDSDDTTGCDVVAHDDNFAGPVKGIEYTVSAHVLRFPVVAEVQTVRVAECDSGTDFFPPNVFEVNGWPVALETGVGGADVIEFYVPRALLDIPGTMTLGFHATRTEIGVNDVLLTKNGLSSGSDIVFDLRGISAPLLSPVALVACVVLFVGLAAWSLRRQRPQIAALMIAAAIATAAATGWAVTIMLDGMLGDWAGVPQIAKDVLDDSTADDPAEDIVVAFVTADAQNIYFRMDQVNLCPVQCGNGVVEAGEECEVPDDCEGQGESPGTGSGAFIPSCLCANCGCSGICDTLRQ